MRKESIYKECIGRYWKANIIKCNSYFDITIQRL